MRIIDPKTGRAYVERRRRRYPEPGQPRELTFSCYRHYPFLARERTREWFREALEAGRSAFGFQLWAYVLMPEHVHLLVYPGDAPDQVSRFLQAVKEPVARKAIAYLKANAPGWLTRLTVQEGKRLRRRFWQPGGGYDRNITGAAALRSMIDYLNTIPNMFDQSAVIQPTECIVKVSLTQNRSRARSQGLGDQVRVTGFNLDLSSSDWTEHLESSVRHVWRH